MKPADLGFTGGNDNPAKQPAEKEQGRPLREAEMRDEARGGRVSLSLPAVSSILK